MLGIATIAGLVVGFFKGGTYNKLSKLPFKFSILVSIALIIQIFIAITSQLLDIPRVFGYLLILFSYLILASALFLNRKDLYIKIILIGVLMNFLVIAVNGGMPLSEKSYQFTGLSRDSLNQKLQNDKIRVLSSDKTDLNFLGEIVPLPKPYPLPSVYSFGDILISFGLFLFLQSHLVYQSKRTKTTVKKRASFRRHKRRATQ